jgi:predicted alpha/beta superfamily hydrolase
MVKLLNTALLLGSIFSLHAQPNISFQQEVSSNHLQSVENIQVYLPASYHEGERRYPVLYILDGQWFFLNGVAIQETLRGDGLLPEMIVIGVDYLSRAYHDSLHSNHWETLNRYVQEELTAFVDQTYRTSDERIVFGWENPSYMVCEFLFKENPTFDGYIVSNGGYINEDMLEQFKTYEGKPLYLYLTNSKKDIYTINSSETLAGKLTAETLNHLKWKYELHNQETHESMAYTSLYQGLRYYYHNYSSKVYSGTKEFYEEGGLAALKRYFRERGERFGLDTAIDASTKNSLIWLAWKHNDFPSFELFMTEFADVLSTRRYASAYWQHRLGQFYLTHNDPIHAIEYFTRGINEYPDPEYMAAMNAGLGSAYALTNEKAKARSSYKEAIRLAKASDDAQLATYQQLLKNLK